MDRTLQFASVFSAVTRPAGVSFSQCKMCSVLVVSADVLAHHSRQPVLLFELRVESRRFAGSHRSAYVRRQICILCANVEGRRPVQKPLWNGASRVWQRPFEAGQMTLQPVVLALGILTVNSPTQVEPTKPSTELVHVSHTFHFEVPASLGRVAPLFGPEAERGLAGKHWNPEFLDPRPGKDIQGSVFQIPHGQHTSLWVNNALRSRWWEDAIRDIYRQCGRDNRRREADFHGCLSHDRGGDLCSNSPATCSQRRCTSAWKQRPRLWVLIGRRALKSAWVLNRNRPKNPETYCIRFVSKCVVKFA